MGVLIREDRGEGLSPSTGSPQPRGPTVPQKPLLHLESLRLLSFLHQELCPPLILTYPYLDMKVSGRGRVKL